MQDLDALQAFAIPGHVAVRTGPGGLPTIEVEAEGAIASVCLQGAHLTRFAPRDQAKPLVWVSEAAQFGRGRSIRGGVPVCWPWFGAAPVGSVLPAHGYARTVAWELLDAALDAGRVQLTLRLTRDEALLLAWPHDTPLELFIDVGDTLRMELTTHNADDQPVRLTEALHTYFQVGDVRQTVLEGLGGCNYLDKTLDFATGRQDGDLRFSGETDRIYVDTEARCDLIDPVLDRRIRIDKTGSHSTVVWTPWQERAATMGDFTPDGWREMVCVESANAATNAVTLAPGELHVLSVEYAVGPI